jgi:hypothetical protein
MLRGFFWRAALPVLRAAYPACSRADALFPFISRHIPLFPAIPRWYVFLCAVRLGRRYCGGRNHCAEG